MTKFSIFVVRNNLIRGQVTTRAKRTTTVYRIYMHKIAGVSTKLILRKTFKININTTSSSPPVMELPGIIVANMENLKIDEVKHTTPTTSAIFGNNNADEGIWHVRIMV